jgi:cell division protein FtsZ
MGIFEVLRSRQEVPPAVIKVCGIGSGGVNAVNNMIAARVTGVEYLVMNTDVQHLAESKADVQIALSGPTGGRGAGGDPAKGREAAEAERERIEEFLRGADLLVLTTGLGGGTGTGAAPVVAEIAKRMKILTLAVVTLPFRWEGTSKAEIAAEGLDVLRQTVDAYIRIPNDKMKKILPKGTKMQDAFKHVDKVLCDAMTGVVELISRPGYINRDFEDVRAVLQGAGLCVIGVGVAGGEDRAMEATRMAVANPLLEDTPIDGAKRILINVVQSLDGTLDENELVAEKVAEGLAPGGKLTIGLAIDEALGDHVKVTVIATGMEDCEIVGEDAVVEVAASAARPVLQDLRAPSFGQPGVRHVEPGAEPEPWRSTSGGPRMVNTAPGVETRVWDAGPVGTSELAEYERIPAYMRARGGSR